MVPYGSVVGESGIKYFKRLPWKCQTITDVSRMVFSSNFESAMSLIILFVFNNL